MYKGADDRFPQRRAELLVRQRYWHALADMLLVVGIVLSVSLGALFVVTILGAAAAGTR